MLDPHSGWSKTWLGPYDNITVLSNININVGRWLCPSRMFGVFGFDSPAREQLSEPNAATSSYTLPQLWFKCSEIKLCVVLLCVAPWQCLRERSQGPSEKQQSTTAPTGPPAAGKEAAAAAPLAPHSVAALHSHRNISVTINGRFET